MRENEQTPSNVNSDSGRPNEVRVIENEPIIIPQESDGDSPIKKFCCGKKNVKWIIIIGNVAIVLVILVTLLAIYLPTKNYPHINDDLHTTIEETNINNATMFEGLSMKYTFNEINVYRITSNSSINFVVDGKSIPLNQSDNYKYIVYTLRIDNAIEEEKKFYNYKIQSVFIKGNENSFKKSQNRNLDETNQDLSKIPFPICIFTHTEENIILSYRCHRSLSEVLKFNIKNDFAEIRPTMLNLDKDPEKLENGQIKATKLFDGKCTDNGEVILLSNCKEESQILLNSDYKLISFDKEYIYDIYPENGNKIYKYLKYNIQKINQEETLNKDSIKELYQKMEPYMSEEVIALDIKTIKENFDKIEEMKKNSGNSRRRLDSLLSINKSIGKEINFFNTNYAGKNLKLSLANNFNLAEDITSSLGYVKIDSDSNNFKYIEEYDNMLIESNLKATFEKLIYLSKASNKLAKNLYDKLFPIFYTIQNELSVRLASINTNLMNSNYATIFDESLNLADTKILKHEIIDEVNKVFNDLNFIKTNEKNILTVLKSTINGTIKTFIEDCHNAIDKIFKNLNASTLSLNEKTNDKYVILEKYYMNETSESIFKRIESCEHILNNYFIEEKKIVFEQLESIIAKFELQSSEDLNDTMINLNYLIDALENKNLTITSANEEETNNTFTKLRDIRNLINDIISEIKDYIKNGIELKNTNYFEDEVLIESNKQKYSSIIGLAKEAANKLYNTDLPDLFFDNTYNNLRQNFTNILEFIKNKKLDDYPLKENVLKDDYFTESKIYEIKSRLQNKVKDIIKVFVDENDALTNVQNTIVFNYQINEQNLKNSLYVIYDLLSEQKIETLYNAYDNMLETLYENLNATLDKNFELGKTYLNEIIEINQSIFYTYGFKQKYNTFINNLNEIIDYIENDVKSILKNKYLTMMTNIKSLVKQLNDIPNVNELSINDNIAPLKKLISEFDNLKLISNEKLITHYIQIITDKSSILLLKANSHLNSLKEIKNRILFRDPTNIFINSGDYCIDEEFDTCRKWSDYWEFCSKEHKQKCESTNNTNNYLQLETLTTKNIENAIKMFDQIYSDYYSKLNEKIKNFTSTINQITKNISNITIDTNEDYLIPFSTEIDSILSEYFDRKFLIATYQYYKKQIQNNFANETTELYKKFLTIYNDLYNLVRLNYNKFEVRASELDMTVFQYYSLYSTNITNDFLNSIVEQNKNEMNYTISFYYGILLSTVKELYLEIEKNIPVNIYGLTTNYDIRIQQVNKLFNQIIEKINTKKTTLLSRKNQLNILNIKEEDFYGVAEILSKNKEEANNTLIKLILDIKTSIDIGYKNPSEENKHLIAGRFFLEASNNGKEINKIYEDVDKINFVDLNLNSFKSLIDTLWGLDIEEFLQLLRPTIIDSKKKIKEAFTILLKNEFKKLLRIGLYELYNISENNSLENKISKIFENGINITEINDDIISSYKQKIIDLKDKINKFFENVFDDIKNNGDEYFYNSTKIQENIDKEKINVYNTLVGDLTEVIDIFKENVIEKLFKEYYYENLNYYRDKIEDIQGILTYHGSNPAYKSKVLNITTLSLEATNEIIEEFILQIRREIEKKYQEYITKLDNIFDFNNILETFNDIFDNGFEKLVNVLDNKYSSNGTEYKFTNNQLNDLDKMIKEPSIKLDLIKGNDYNVENYNKTLNDLDFYFLYTRIFLPIKNIYDNFMMQEDKKIEEETIEIIKSNAKTAFIAFINRLMNYFGKDFIKRMIRYNEIQKIQSLYTNLCYSAVKSYLHYENMAVVYKTYYFSLPQNLLQKLIKMNDIWQLIEDKNYNIKIILKKNLDEFIYDSGIYIVNKFINNIIEKINIDELDITGSGKFENLTIEMNNIIPEILEEYNKIMKKEFKISFEEQYMKTLKENTQYVLDTLKTKNQTFIKNTETSFFNDSINVLSQEINNNLTNIKIALNEFNHLISSFDIENQLFENLIPVYRYANDILVQKNKNYLNMLFESTKDKIYKNVEDKTNEFLNKFDKDKFVKNINEMMNYFKIIFDKAIIALNEYGYETGYINVLNKEINILNSTNNRRNLLEHYEDNMMSNSYKRKVIDLKLNDILQKIQSMFLNVNWIIKENSLYNEFYNDLLSYKSKSDVSYLESINLINDKCSTDEIKNKLKNEARNLLNHQYDYYDEVEISYTNLKDSLKNNIEKIGMTINKCMEETYGVLTSQYNSIENGLKKRHEKLEEYKIIEKIIKPDEFIYNRDIYGIEINITNITRNIKMDIDIKYEYKDNLKIPKVYANIDSIITPKEIEIKMFKKSNDNSRHGIKLILKPMNNSINSMFSYGAAENDMILITNVLFDTYNYMIYSYDTENKKVDMEITLNDITYTYYLNNDNLIESKNILQDTITKTKVIEKYNEGQVYEKPSYF